MPEEKFATLSWMQMGFATFLAGVVALVQMISEWGLETLKELMYSTEDLNVKLIDEHAVLPSLGSDGAAGYDLCTCRDFVLGPGESKLESVFGE